MQRIKNNGCFHGMLEITGKLYTLQEAFNLNDETGGLWMYFLICRADFRLIFF